MSLFITSLNSGSNGNSYYIGNHHEAILIDAGISCREIEKRMNRLGLSINRVKAVFVSHEHTDHIKGVPALAKKFQLPIYITPGTLEQGRLKIDQHLIRSFIPHNSVIVGELSITAFPKFHDACDPYSFSVMFNNIKVGIFTDIGRPCEQLIRYFKECHAAFLESNYDETMLENGSYPYFLKSRIRGGNGHLSNTQAFELFCRHRPSFMSHLVLAHLSKNNNCPELVGKLFNGNANGVRIAVAGRYAETEVFKIENNSPTLINVPTSMITGRQLSLSFN